MTGRNGKKFPRARHIRLSFLIVTEYYFLPRRGIWQIQNKVVTLQQNRRYGTVNYRGAEAVTPEYDTGERNERLGICSFRERGRPTLGNRWDTLVYEEGLQSQQPNNLLGGSRLATQRESDKMKI